MRGWVKVLLIMIALPFLLGAVVVFIAGRPLAFELLQWRTASKFPEVKWITTDELAQVLSDPGRTQPVVLDARTGPEFGVSHVRGAQAIDPYRPFLNTIRAFPRDTPVVVYSSVGYRGARVTSWLANAGYREVRNLSGGLFQWANEGKPLFKEENRPTAMVHPYDGKWGLLVQRQYRAQAPQVERRSAAP
jgi:rhodanese-related sulfurtransferase